MKKVFLKNKIYSYKVVKEYCESINVEFIELGKDFVGQHFLVFEIGNATYSFVLCSVESKTRSQDYQYKCLFNG